MNSARSRQWRFALAAAAIFACGGRAAVVDTLSPAIDAGDGLTSIFEAASGTGDITFSVSGTISGTGIVSISDGRTLDGGGQIVFDGIRVEADTGAIIRNLGIINCADSGITLGSNCTVTNCTIGANGAVAAPNNAALSPNGGGVLITGSGNTIGGAGAGEGNLISGNANAGILLRGAVCAENTIRGNIVGLNSLGTAALANSGRGILVNAGAHDNTIGPGNIISGNAGPGIGLDGTGTTANTVIGNVIGLALDGAAALGNGDDGVLITGNAQGNTIGGTGAGDTNTISGNAGAGVHVNGANANTIAGNRIGLTSDGLATAGNGTFGVLIEGATNITKIGVENGGNVISGNLGDGVRVRGVGTDNNMVQHNLIGTDASGLLALSNLGAGVSIFGGPTSSIVRSNIVAGNAGHGITVSGTFTNGTSVASNTVGLGSDGDTTLANGLDGIAVVESSLTMIGGEGTGNTVSGNTGDGIVVTGEGALYTSITGNYIGTDAVGASARPNGGVGVRVEDGAVSTSVGLGSSGLGNVISGNTQGGIVFSGADTRDNYAYRNYIGVNASATAALPNEGPGILIEAGAQNTLVGASNAENRNIISGNAAEGIRITGAATSNSQVVANYIGLSASGNASLGNGGAGILIDGAPGNVIGGPLENDYNLITANAGGVYITGAGASGNIVRNNYIGWFRSAGPASNNGNGVRIADGATNNFIGGEDTYAGNHIVGSTGDGVAVAGAATTGNSIRRTGIFGSGGKGIFLDGGNLLFPSPVIVSIGAETTGTAAPGSIIDLFADPEDEGRVYVGSTTTGNDGVWVFTGDLTGYATADLNLTATATGDDNTSEFSAPVTLECGAPTLVCPADVTVKVPAGVLSAFVELPLPVVTPGQPCGRPIRELTNTFTNKTDGNGFYPIGATVSSWEAVDIDGGMGTCSITVTVEVDATLGIHTTDQDANLVISLSELLRIIQFYNSLGFHCAALPGDTEDGYVPGAGEDQSCAPHEADYNPQDWNISLSELLRIIQFYNSLGYRYCPEDGTEDGFCPGPA